MSSYDKICPESRRQLRVHEVCVVTLRTGWNERLRHHIPKLRVAIASSMLHLAKKTFVRTIGTIAIAEAATRGVL